MSDLWSAVAATFSCIVMAAMSFVLWAWISDLITKENPDLESLKKFNDSVSPTINAMAKEHGEPRMFKSESNSSHLTIAAAYELFFYIDGKRITHDHLMCPMIELHDGIIIRKCGKWLQDYQIIVNGCVVYYVNEDGAEYWGNDCVSDSSKQKILAIIASIPKEIERMKKEKRVKIEATLEGIVI